MREAPPIPYDDLLQLQQELAADYGSRLWEGDGKAVLVARVPGETPDFVNDLEHIVDLADPIEVDKAEKVLLVASRQVHQVPVAPLKDLMRDRVLSDRSQCDMLRTQLPGSLAHTFYRAPDDPKRRLRLGVRIPCERVSEVDDDVLEELVEQLGPRLEKGFDDVHCVYLVAASDHVRLDTDLFLQDLHARWKDEDRRARMEAQHRARQEAEKRRRERDRAALIAHLESKFPKDVKYAPVRHRSREIDYEVPEVRETVVEETAAEQVKDFRSGSEHLDAVCARLDAAGYDIMVRPAVPGHEVDVAAERADAYPQRVIVRQFDRLRLADAEAVLRACKDLEVDLAIVVADATDPEAQRRVVATKVKRLRPADIGSLRL